VTAIRLVVNQRKSDRVAAEKLFEREMAQRQAKAAAKLKKKSCHQDGVSASDCPAPRQVG
jgi:hypothetical protein